MNRPVRVLVADDHTIVRKGLCSLLEMEEGIVVVGEAEDGREALSKIDECRPDVVLLDITMPGLNGIETTRRINRQYPEVKVVILTMHLNEEYIFEALRAGASGYLLKRTAPTDLISAIRAAHRGESFLSPSVSRKVIEQYVQQGGSRTDLHDPFDTLTTREREVLQLIAEGRSPSAISDVLFVSVKTVESHRSNLLRKLQVKSTAELTQYAVRKGLVSLEE
ncbi:MAG TPA: response regulator transcription factor [Desulfobacteraceae bacterium]|nr:response regulator transcription factor [Desulfobacteraceae bacterium]